MRSKLFKITVLLGWYFVICNVQGDPLWKSGSYATPQDCNKDRDAYIASSAVTPPAGSSLPGPLRVVLFCHNDYILQQ